MTPFFLLQKFVLFLQKEKRASKHTILGYKKDIQQYLNEYDQETLQLNNKYARNWMMELSHQGLSNKTINRKLSALRAFHKWLKKEGFIPISETFNPKGPKSEKRLPVFVQERDMKLNRIDLDPSMDFESYRDGLMVELFYQTGIRLSELINLTEENSRGESIKVLGKRNKERIIPISDSLQDNIKTYIQKKRELGFSGAELLVKINGDKLYPKLVYRRINSYLGEVTNLDKRSPHILRHTFATHMLNNGAGLETIKEILGHADLSATQVYTHNSFSQLSNIYSQAHPRGHKKG